MDSIRQAQRKHLAGYGQTPRNTIFENLNRISRAFELVDIIQQAAEELQPFLEEMDAKDEYVQAVIDLDQKIELFEINHLNKLKAKYIRKYKKL